MFDEYIKKQKRHNNDLKFLAWHTAYFNRVEYKHFPSYKSLIEDESEKKKQTPEEMINNCMHWNSLLGGKVVEV
jgi:hypothetical protein